MASNQTQCEMCCNGNAVEYCKTCGNIGESTNATHIDCDQDHVTTPALYIIRDIIGKIKRMKEKVDQRNETNNTNVVEGNKELDNLDSKSQETCTTNDRNIDANSMGSASPEMQMTRKELIGAFIQAKLDIEKAEATRQDLCNELKLVKQDLDNSEKTRKQQCVELKKELDSSEKTMKELCEELKQVKHDLKMSEKTRQELCNELKLVKQDLDYSKKTRKQQCDELKQKLDTSEKTRRELTALLNQTKQDLDQSEKARNELCDELKQVKQDIDNSEKKRKIFEQELQEANEESEKEKARVKVQLSRLKDIIWTQPTGTVNVNTFNEHGGPSIYLVFTFPDGIQATRHPSPGKTYKGGKFSGLLSIDDEGELLCKMLKAAFRKGLMFNCGKEGTVVLDGVSLHNSSVYEYRQYSWENTTAYDRYILTLKAELAAKGITEADTDKTEKFKETFTVDGLSVLLQDAMR